MTDSDDSPQSLIQRLNNIGKKLEWWVEDRDKMIKVILIDKKINFRRALYVCKNNGKAERRALSGLIKTYCYENNIQY